MIFGCQSSIIHTSVDIHIDIQARISMQGHSAMDIRKQEMSINGYSWFYGYQFSIIYAFMDIHLDILGCLWISMHWLAIDSRSRENHSTLLRPNCAFLANLHHKINRMVWSKQVFKGWTFRLLSAIPFVSKQSDSRARHWTPTFFY